MQPFNKAAYILRPTAIMEHGSMRFMEMAPFIFVMSDETFEKWMTVQEMAEDGRLIAFNRTLQCDGVPQRNSTSWHLKKSHLRHLQGMEESDLNKIASFFIAHERVSLLKEKVHLKSHDPEEAKKWSSLEEYCVEKKNKKTFEVFLIATLTKKPRIPELGKVKKLLKLRKFSKQNRKHLLKHICDYFHLGKEKLLLFREALGEKFVKEAGKKSSKWEDLFTNLPASFEALIAATRDSINGEGRVCKVDLVKLLTHKSSTGFGSAEFFRDFS